MNNRIAACRHRLLLTCSLLLLALGVSSPAAAAPVTVLRSFAGGADASVSFAGTTAHGATLYGISGQNVYSMNVNATGRTTLRSFPASGATGGAPGGALAVDGTSIYGASPTGGNWGVGTLWKMNHNGSGFQVLRTFDYSTFADTPQSGLTLFDGRLYGSSRYGGAGPAPGLGAAFSLKPDGSDFSELYTPGFEQGWYPDSPLVNSGTKLYGVAPYSDVPDINGGTIFTLGGIGGAAVVKTLQPGQGSSPRILGAVGDDILMTTYYPGHVYTLKSDGSGYTRVFDVPNVSMTRVGDLLYGVTASGGTFNNGAIFSVRGDGTEYQIVHSFERAVDGSSPFPVLVAEGDRLYGTTRFGGANNAGTVFMLQVPEPGSLALATVGMIAAVAMMFKRRRWR